MLWLHLSTVFPQKTVGKVRSRRWCGRRVSLPAVLVDGGEVLEPQVGDVSFVFAVVVVCGEDVGDASASDQRNTLVTGTFGNKQKSRLRAFDLSRPEGESVLLGVDDESVLPPLTFLLFVVHLRILVKLRATGVSIESTSHK